MGTQPVFLDDQMFLAQFEDKTLDPAQLSHLGHLRVAWLYLLENEFDVANELICQGIKAYAESKGANEKFNLTMTDAIVRIMAQRIEGMAEKRWDLFLQQNRDLVEDFESVLYGYYSKELLLSKAARISLVNPDIKSI